MVSLVSPIRALGLGLLLAGTALAGWLPIDSITNRGTSDMTCQSNARSVASDAAGNIHVVWRGRVSGTYQVWYSGRDAASGQWTPDTALTSVAGGVCDPACALGPDQALLVAWNDSASGTLHLLTRDTTGRWTRLDSLVGRQNDGMVSLCLDSSGKIHAVWRGSDISGSFVCYASHGDTGWSRPDTLTANGMHGSWPSITCSPGDAAMAVWVGSGGYSIVSRRCIADSWQDPEVVYDGYAADPCVAWGADSFYAAWLGGNYPTQHVLARARSVYGWSDTAKLNVWRVGQPGVSIAADVDGALHVAWSGYDSASQNYNHIQYAVRPSAGVWQRQQRLDSADADRLRVSVSARGGMVQVAWTELAPSVPAVRLRRYERIHDVGALRIEQLADTVDSGAVAWLRGWLKNYGDFVETEVPVWLTFSGYADVETLPWIIPEDVDRIQFDSTALTARGLQVVSCSTALVGDAKPANDAVHDSFFVRVCDVGADSILAPDSTVYDAVLVPRVRVRNRGNVPSEATVRAWIDSTDYHDSLVVLLRPDGDSAVILNPWETEPGSYVFRCSVAYAPDVHPENDTLSRHFWVVARDVGVSAILSPPAMVDSGSAVVPLALVKNCGNRDATFPVQLTIDTAYNPIEWVTLASSESGLVPFDTWRPSVRGVHAVRCSTLLAGDRNHGNDMRSCSVFVRVRDVAPVKILSPAEVISRGEVRPRVRIANRGNMAENIPARFEIVGDSSYHGCDTVAVGPGDSAEAEFPLWLARSGEYTGVCWTELTGDMRPDNDTLSCPFHVARTDAAALAIRAPMDTISDGWVEPRISVANYGEDHATFFTHFVCEQQGSTVYHDSVLVTLDSMRQEDVALREWKAVPGDYRVLARVVLGGDENSHNDSVTATVHVESLESRHWKERAPVPRGPSGRKVRDGGSLVAVGDGLIAFKGANTCECYRYVATADSWTAVACLPPGADSHRVRSGAALCWDGGDAVFALKGTGTREFWRYNMVGDSWHALAGLPGHTRGARYGSGLVFLSAKDGDQVFMVKGSNTRDFLVYWVAQDEWHARRPLPSGPNGAAARYGTCVALLGGHIFCLKGRTTEFYEYFPDGDSWLARADLPRLDRGRKPARGAALVSDGSRFLYALKGGGVNEFWRYDSRDDVWVQLDELPAGNRRRKVGRGGALAWLGGRAYALKGGGANEFWCFDPLALTAVPRLPRGVAAEAGVQLPAARRAPVFVRCGFPVEYPVHDGITAVVVTDATGRVISRQAPAHHLVSLSFSRPGVYFVVMTGDSGTSAAKMTVVR